MEDSENKEFHKVTRYCRIRVTCGILKLEY